MITCIFILLDVNVCTKVVDLKAQSLDPEYCKSSLGNSVFGPVLLPERRLGLKIEVHHYMPKQKAFPTSAHKKTPATSLTGKPTLHSLISWECVRNVLE